MYVDPWASTQPTKSTRETRRSCCSGCGLLFTLATFTVIAIGVFMFVPGRTNVLALGIDRTPEGTSLGRSDTIILSTFIPTNPYVGMLSIPRDLWVTIPDVGENRINTAHFFAESAQQGQGPLAALRTVSFNFGIDVNYYIRVRFDGLIEIVDSMGGIEIELDSPTGGYGIGKHQLDGEKALAFVRDREGTDDFFRMERGQIFLKSIVKQILKPKSWIRIPTVMGAVSRSTDTNIPLWQWPRIGFAILLTGPENIDNRVVSRDMVHPTTTPSGAQVLIPDWPKINPVLLEMFGQ